MRRLTAKGPASMEPAEVSHAPNTRASPGLGNQAALRSRGLLPTSRAIIDNRMVVGDAHAPSEQRANEVADAASRGDAVPTVGVNLAPPPSELALGAGRPLDSSLRGSLAPTFGDSLSNVRIHDDRAAGRAANQLGANAFTLGGHIVFGHGHYQPQTSQGHRLLTHELAHATAGEAPHIARCDGPRDFEYEIERLSTSEIDAELQSVRTRLLQLEASGESTPEYARLDRQQAALERALGARDRTRLGHARTVQALRVADPFQLAVPADQLFVMSIVNGYRSEVPVGTLLDGSERVLRSPGQYTLGYLRGLPDGLWAGLVGMVEGLGMLAGLALDLIVDSIPGIELYRYASDPAGYMRREREQQAKMRAIGSAFLNFFREFAADPSIVVQMNADLGFTLGEELARMHATFSSQSAFDQGRDIGNFVGQVVFEVLIEIILAVATEGIGNVIRGVAAIGQGARQGSRFANAIRRILDASPVVRRLINSLARVEEGASAVRRVERATDAVDAERRIAAAADGQIDDAARRLESRAPAPEAPRSTEPPLVSEQPRAPDAPRAPEPQRVSEPPAPEPPRVAEQPRAPEAPQAPEPPRPVQPARPPRRPVPDHARRSGNFTTVDPLINDVVPDPLPAQLADHYRYVTNPRPPPPRSLRRIDADERFAQLSIDRDGRLQYADRTRPRPDIPFDAELARPLDIPESARLAPSQPIPAARNAPPGAPARSVDDAVTARRQAQTEARDLRASGDEASAARRETVVRQESEALGDAAARSYMQPQNGLPAYEGTGPNTLDQVYRSADSQADFVVVEAKGGSATNTSSRLDAQGVRHQQGTEGYLRSIIDGSLATPPTANLPRDLAQNLRNALEDGRLRYLEVSQPIARDGSLLPPVARLYF